MDEPVEIGQHPGKADGIGYPGVEFPLERPRDAAELILDTGRDLFQAMGFELIGTYPDAGHKLGRWNDVSRFWLPLQARGEGPVCAAPPETRTLAAVLATPEGVAALAAGQALLQA